MPKTLPITFHGEELHLHPDRALWWPRRRTLVLSDVHLGKSATFRAHGIPVPEGENEEDLTRIKQLVDHYKSESLIIVGDLLHSSGKLSATLSKTLNDWLNALPCSVTLVLGNHDPNTHLLSKLPKLNCQQSLRAGPITFIHDPKDAKEDEPSIAGHLHPLFKIKPKQGPSQRVPCFLQKQNLLILPAFGTFTAGATIDLAQGTNSYPVTDGTVFQISA